MAHISQLAQVHSIEKTLSITPVLSRGTNPVTNSMAMGTPSPKAAVLQLMHLPVLKVSLKKNYINGQAKKVVHLIIRL